MDQFLAIVCLTATILVLCINIIKKKNADNK
jgi:hypothetical protein